MDAFVCSPSPELSINGELNSEANKGFSTIVIHLKGDLHIEVDSSQIVVLEGKTETRHTGEEQFTVGRCCSLLLEAHLLWREALMSSLTNRHITPNLTRSVGGSSQSFRSPKQRGSIWQLDFCYPVWQLYKLPLTLSPLGDVNLLLVLRWSGGTRKWTLWSETSASSSWSTCSRVKNSSGQFWDGGLQTAVWREFWVSGSKWFLLFFNEIVLVPPVTLLVFSVLQPVVYQELQQLPKKLKIDNQEIEATRFVCHMWLLKC